MTVNPGCILESPGGLLNPLLLQAHHGRGLFNWAGEGGVLRVTVAGMVENHSLKETEQPVGFRTSLTEYFLRKHLSGQGKLWLAKEARAWEIWL